LADASEIDEAALRRGSARAARQPYLPLIAIDPQMALADNAISHPGHSDRLIARLRAALRIGMHATVMRGRLSRPRRIIKCDLAREATVLLSAVAALSTLSVHARERSASSVHSRSKPRRTI